MGEIRCSGKSEHILPQSHQYTLYIFRSQRKYSSNLLKHIYPIVWNEIYQSIFFPVYSHTSIWKKECMCTLVLDPKVLLMPTNKSIQLVFKYVHMNKSLSKHCKYFIKFVNIL